MRLAIVSAVDALVDLVEQRRAAPELEVLCQIAVGLLTRSAIQGHVECDQARALDVLAPPAGSRWTGCSGGRRAASAAAVAAASSPASTRSSAASWTSGSMCSSAAAAWMRPAPPARARSARARPLLGSLRDFRPAGAGRRRSRRRRPSATRNRTQLDPRRAGRSSRRGLDVPRRALGGPTIACRLRDVFASARISRASSSACRRIAAARRLLGGVDDLLAPARLRRWQATRCACARTRLSSSTSSEIAVRCASMRRNCSRAAPDWEVLDALPIKRHSSSLRSRLRLAEASRWERDLRPQPGRAGA